MQKKQLKWITCALTATITFSCFGLQAQATGLNSVLPAGGVNLTLAKGPSLESVAGEKTETKIETNVEITEIEDIKTATSILEQKIEEESFKSLVIAQVNKYVNIRSIPSEDGEVVGKLYDKSVGTFISEENGWYQITSGSVTGYVKGEYCVTGEAAVALAKEVGVRIAKVNTTTLKVRQEPSLESSVLGLIPIDDELLVIEELDDWIKVNIEEGDGYVAREYVSLRTEFVQAESKAEEEARLEKERKEREAAQAAARASRQSSQSSSSTSSSSSSNTTSTSFSSDGSMGAAVVEYALQFVGNPYVYGGSSLTNGADCSGFVMSVYANFGVSLPHSSASDRTQGYAVDGLENAMPGDLICYSGHVAIYMGGGQIVHASTPKTGIIVSSATTRQILAIRRIF